MPGVTLAPRTDHYSSFFQTVQAKGYFFLYTVRVREEVKDWMETRVKGKPGVRWGGGDGRSRKLTQCQSSRTGIHIVQLNFHTLFSLSVSGWYDQDGARGVFYRASREGRWSDQGGRGRRREEAHRLSLCSCKESAHQQHSGRIPLQRSVCGSQCPIFHLNTPFHSIETILT